MSSRFVLSFRGDGLAPQKDIIAVRQSAGTRVVDVAPRMLLVEGRESVLKELLTVLPKWRLSKDQSYVLPDPRPRVRRT